MNTIKKYGSWLVAAAMALASAGAWGATVVEVGTADALRDALAAAADGDTVRLAANIDAPYGYPLATIDKSVTIDLAGKKLTAAGGSYSYGAGVFKIDSATATVTMDDSVGGGAIDTDYSMMFYVNKGNMVFKGGTYSAAGTVVLTYAADYSVDLKGGTFVGKDTGSSYRQVILIGGGFLTVEDGVTIEQQGTGSYNKCVVLSSGDSAATKQTEASKLVMNGGHIIASKASYGYAIACEGFNSSQLPYRNGNRRYEEVVINGGTVDTYDRYGNLVNISGAAQVTVNDVMFNFNCAPADSDWHNWKERTTVGAFSGIPSDSVCHSLSKITVNGGTFNFFTRIVRPNGYTGYYGAVYSAPYSSEAQDSVVVNGGTFTGLNYTLNFTEGKGMQWWVPSGVKMTVDPETGDCVVRQPSVQVAEVTAAQVAEKAKAVDDSGAEIAEPTPEQTAQIEAVAVKLAKDIGKGADLLDVVDSGIAAAGTASGNKYLDITYSEMKVAVGESVVTKEIVHTVKPMVKAPDAEEAVVIPNEEIKKPIRFRLIVNESYKDKFAIVQHKGAGDAEFKPYCTVAVQTVKEGGVESYVIELESAEFSEYKSILSETFVVQALQGSGTKDNPFQVHNQAELAFLRAHQGDYGSKFIVLTADIDFAGDAFGACVGLFGGTFDGQGHVIRDLKVDNGDANSAGLFGGVFGATIKNLTLENPTVATTGENYAGAIAGNGYVHIENCTVKGGSVTGRDQVGGIIGYLSCGSVTGCTVDGVTITANGDRAGGITGKANVDSEYRIFCNTVKGCAISAAKKIDGFASAAGLVGQIMASSKNSWSITENTVLDTTTTTAGDDTFVPVGEFRNGCYQADAVTAGHIARNHWESSEATLPDSYDLADPAGTGDPVTIENFYPAAKIVGSPRLYATLAEALADVKDGDTIQMLANETLTKELTIAEGKSFTLDLNGKTIDNAATGFEFTTTKSSVGSIPARFMIIVEGSVTICDRSESAQGLISASNYGYGTTKALLVKNNGFVVLESGKIYGQYAGCYVVGYTGMTPTETTIIPTLTVNGGEISGETLGVGIKGKTAMLTVNEGAIVKGNDAYGISTNGTTDWYDGGNCRIVINGGLVESVSGNAIYNPAESVVEIKGGVLKGATCVAVKGGNVTISDEASLIATGAKGDPGAAFSGVSETGDALYIEDSYSDHAPVVSVTGGKFKSANGYVVQYWTNKESGRIGSVDLAGGYYVSEPSAAYVNAAYEALANTNAATKAEGYAWMIAKKPTVAEVLDAQGQKVGESYSLQLAIDAVAEGGTVRLTAHSYEDVNAGTKGFTLALNGFRYMGKATAADGYELTVGANGNLVYSKSDVAVVGETGYKTLEAALAAANAGDTVRLVRDVAVEGGVTVGKAITLDLAGKTLTAGLNATAACTVTDSVGGGKVAGTLAGSLVITGGKYTLDPTAFVDLANFLVQDNGDGWTVVAKEMEISADAEKVLENSSNVVVNAAGEEIAIPAGVTEQQVAGSAAAAVGQAVSDIAGNAAAGSGTETGVSDKSLLFNEVTTGGTTEDVVKPAVSNELAGAIATATDLTDTEKEQAQEKLAASQVTSKLEIEFVGTEVATVIAQPAEEGGFDITSKVTTVTFSVRPMMMVTVETDDGGNPTNKLVKREITNDMLGGRAFSFNLPLPGSYEGKRVIIRHRSADSRYPVEVYEPMEVLGAAPNGCYVRLTFTHFSEVDAEVTDLKAAESTDTEKVLGILRVDRPASGEETAICVPWVRSGVREAADIPSGEYVTTGMTADDAVRFWNPTNPANAYVGAGEAVAKGSTFWFRSGAESSVPVTVSGLADGQVAVRAQAGTADKAVMTLMAHPFREEADVLTKLSGPCAEGDQIVLEAGELRYRYDGGKWGKVVRGTTEPSVGTRIYGANGFEEVTEIVVPAGKAFWYVSRGGSPTVRW